MLNGNKTEHIKGALLVIAIVALLSACDKNSDSTSGLAINPNPIAIPDPVVTPNPVIPDPINLFAAEVHVEQGFNNNGFDIYHNTAQQLAIGDFNNDGFDDVVATYPGIESADISKAPHTAVAIKIFLQDGFGGIYDGTSHLFDGAVPKTHFTRNISIGDFNGDGQVDIFLANHGIEDQQGYGMAYWGESDTLILSQANGKYTNASANIVWSTSVSSLNPNNWDGQFGHYTHGSTVADFENDGDLDLLVNTTTGVGTVILVNDGTGNFTEHDKMGRRNNGATFSPYVNDATLWSSLIDVDNDSDLDVVLAGKTLYRNDGAGNFNWDGSRVDMPAPIGLGRVEDMITDDINGDGNIDLIVSNADATTTNQFLQILIGNGDGTFFDDTLKREENGDVIDSSIIVTGSDFNGDGKKDLLMTDTVFTSGMGNTTYVNVYTNFNGVFRQVDTGIVTQGHANIVPIDLSNDGDIDIVVSEDGMSYFTANKSMN